MLTPPQGYSLQPNNSPDSNSPKVATSANASIEGKLKAPDGFVLAKKVNIPTGDPMRSGVPSGYCIIRGHHPRPSNFIPAIGGL